MLFAIIASVVIGAVILIIIFRSHIRKYVAGKSFHGDQRLDGKTAVITGGNSGIGKETARELAKRGAKVILACRDVTKAERVSDEIKEDTKNDNVSVAELDLASLQSIRKFADHINKTESRLDLLINNAGVLQSPRSETQDGFERHFGVNHLGHFLLTNLLLDLLERSAPSRVVTVSAHLHFIGKIHFDDLMLTQGYRTFPAYAQSKLANIMFTRQLAKRSKGVYAFSLHPGVINTNIGRSIPLVQTLMNFLEPIFFKTPEEGAQTTLYCALSDDVKEFNGLYFSNCSLSCPVKEGFNEERCARLWEVSEKLVGIAESRNPIEQDADVKQPGDSDSDVIMGVVNEDENKRVVEVFSQSKADDDEPSTRIVDVSAESVEDVETLIERETKSEDSDVTKDIIDIKQEIAEAIDQVEPELQTGKDSFDESKGHDLETVREIPEKVEVVGDTLDFKGQDIENVKGISDITESVVDTSTDDAAKTGTDESTSVDEKVPQIDSQEIVNIMEHIVETAQSKAATHTEEPRQSEPDKTNENKPVIPEQDVKPLQTDPTNEGSTHTTGVEVLKAASEG